MNLNNLFEVKPAHHCRTRRSSSYDRAGGNIDFRRIPAGGTLVILDVDGPGIVTHLWFALTHMDYNYLRTLLLRAWWDGEEQPSIECPLGDFFGVGHAVARGYSSLVMDMTRGRGQRGEATGVNCYLPMPFATHARIEVVNESRAPCQACYYTVNWLQVPRAQVAEAGRFHASWRRENPKRTTPVTETSQIALGRFGANLTGHDNYTVADIPGAGRFVGMNLSIDNLEFKVLDGNLNAFGEGDEMIFLDDEPWPPALHGTGTEDYFTHAWGMTDVSGFYAGASLPVKHEPGRRQRGTCYRWHLLDPVYFHRRLRFTFENGPNNCQANDMASTAYWYQAEPHQPFEPVPVAARLPRPDTGDPSPTDEARVILALGQAVDAWYDIFMLGNRQQVNALAGTLLSKAVELRDQFLRGQITVANLLAELAPCEDAVRKIGVAAP